MSEGEISDKDEGIELAQRLAEEEEGIGRRPKGLTQWVIPTIAVAWSLFQLSTASWLILDSTYIRAIHLAFAMLIVFLNYPLLKKARFGLKYFSLTEKIPFLDYVLAVVAAFSALYIAIDYDGLAMRYGMPILRDLVIGVVLVLLLLEASRRVIGPALPVIASLFIVYAFAGPYISWALPPSSSPNTSTCPTWMSSRPRPCRLLLPTRRFCTSPT
ncbi:MAG: hypothetical protein WAM73_11590 [Desulfobacterales bacterium]